MPVYQTTNVAPSLGLTQFILSNGIFPSRDGSYASNDYLGTIHTFAGNFNPFGNLGANGGLVAIRSNTALFSLLGVNYGGSGVVDFALPNTQAAHTAAADTQMGQGPGLSSHYLGQWYGDWDLDINQSNLSPNVGGSSQPIDNTDATLSVNYGIWADGNFPSGGGDAFIGGIVQTAAGYTPGGAIPCDGRALNIADYQALYAVIGTTYGGDGETTFNVPDLRGRTIVGTGYGPGLNGVQLGEVFGTETTTLTNNNLPAAQGGSYTPFNNYGPSLGMTYLIAIEGVFPSRDGGGGLPEGEPVIGEVVAYAGAYGAGGFEVPGYLPCNGQILNIAQNQALFSILGTTYGGNGVTTFALPDLRGRSVMGTGTQFGETVVLGEIFGTPNVTIPYLNLPALMLVGTLGNDARYGGNLNDVLSGLSGNDYLFGNAGNDRLNGGAGDDVMDGGFGDDFYLVDSAGDVVVEYANFGTDTVQAQVSYTLAGNVENLLLIGAAADGTGNNLGNTITGNGLANELRGLDGNDTLDGLTGNDALHGGEGLDTLDGGAGNDVLYGDAGDDTLDGNNGTDELHGGAGADTLIGGTGNDTLYGDAGLDTLSGGTGNDVLNGGDDRDTLYGESGNDVLNGDAGDDILDGGIGTDTLNGGVGIDHLIGGAGRDIVTGGADADTFVFANGDFGGATGSTADRITDFDHAQGDLIDLVLVDADTTTDGVQSFTFVGTDAFSGTAGELRYAIVGGNTQITGDTDGDGVADFMIRLDGIHVLTQQDFVLASSM